MLEVRDMHTALLVLNVLDVLWRSCYTVSILIVCDLPKIHLPRSHPIILYIHMISYRSSTGSRDPKGFMLLFLDACVWFIGRLHFVCF